MVKLQEDNAKLKQELQTLQSNHDKLDKEFKSLTGLHYQLKLACLWTVGWDFENATSCHHLADPLQAPQKLWAAPEKFVFDGTTCCIYFNAFGPEVGFILGTCEHMYHPICLIAHMVIRRRCSQCKAPFHKQLYKLFGFCPYMPPSWEHNPENTLGMPSRWGQDLVWNWKMSAHTLNKSAFSFAIG